MHLIPFSFRSVLSQFSLNDRFLIYIVLTQSRHEKITPKQIPYFRAFFAMLFLRDRTICCHILIQIRNGVPLRLQISSRKRHARCRSRVHPKSMIDIIRIQPRSNNFIFRQALRELMDDRAHHFQMREFVRVFIVSMIIVTMPAVLPKNASVSSILRLLRRVRNL